MNEFINTNTESLNTSRTSYLSRFLITAIICMLSAGFSYANSDQKKIDEIGKELELMTSVLSTALKQGNDEQVVKFSNLDGHYLDKQGVVFTVNTNARGNRFNFSFGSSDAFPTILAPAAPLPPLSSIQVGDLRISDSLPVVNSSQGLDEELVVIKRELDDAFSQLDQSSSELNVVMQTLRSKQRELRNIAREKRDLDFELLSAPNERREELEQKIEKLNEQQAALTKEQIKRNSELEKFKQQREQQRLASLDASKKLKTEFLEHFTNSVADNLCRFGSGLRALPENENMTFLLKDFEIVDGKNRRDRVYVFSAKDIKRCVQEKIDHKALLANASTYLF